MLKKLVWLLLLFPLFAVAQAHEFPPIDIVLSNPAGTACTGTGLERYQSGLYVCQGGLWTNISAAFLSPALSQIGIENPFDGFVDPWGGAIGASNQQLTGPPVGAAIGQALDQRFGVPLWMFNNSSALTNRTSYWPSFVMNYTGQGMTGTYNNPAGALNAQFNAWTGANNFYNDKTELSALNVILQKFSEGQAGAGMSYNAQGVGSGDLVGLTINQLTRGGFTQSDEGSELTRWFNFQSTEVFTGTISSTSVASNGVTTLGTSSQVYTNMLGGNLQMLITTPSKVYNTGYISNIATVGGNIQLTCSGCTLDSTFGTSFQTTLSAAIANPGSTNSFPQSNVVVTIPSGASNFTVGTNACIWDYDWECEKITANNGSTTVTLARVTRSHPSGAWFTTGGLGVGYGVELEYDRVIPGGLVLSGADAPAWTQTLRQVYPIMENLSGNKMVLFLGYNQFPGTGGAYTGRAYMSLGAITGTSCTPTIAGGQVTSVAIGFSGGNAQNLPQITFSGSWTTPPSAYVNNSFGATMINNGSGVTSATCTVAAVNPFDIYPMAKTLSTYNTSTSTVDGNNITTEPFPVATAINDTLEQPDSHQQHVPLEGPSDANQMFPTLSNEARSIRNIGGGGLMQGGDILLDMASDSNPLLYAGYPLATPGIGGQGQLTTANMMLARSGPWRHYFEISLPPFAPGAGYFPSVIYENCGIACSNWTSLHYLFGLQGATQTNGITYIPATDTIGIVAKNFNLNGTNVNLPLLGTTASIGGSALAVGASATGTATITGATTSMVCTAQPSDGTNMWSSSFVVGCTVTAANTATVNVMAIVAGTPTAKTYNVRVIQ